MKVVAAIVSMVVSGSSLGAEPQAMLYLTIPFGEPPQVSFLLGSRDFRLTYRPKADGDASAIADAASSVPNWLLIGGAVAIGAVLIHQERKSPRTDDHPCPAVNPPPPECR